MTSSSARPDFTPIYYRIEESLRNRIAAGEFEDGKPLPSETALAREFRTTRGTVRQALAPLVFEGLIVREVGRGTFVSRRRVESRLDTSVQQSFEEQMESKGSKVALQVLGFAPVPAPANVAEKLELGRGEPVYRLERLRLVDGAVVALEIRYLVAALGARLSREAVERQPAVALIEETLGTPIATMALTIRAAAATRDLSRKLQVGRGSPLLVREHTFFDLDGRRILWGEAIYRGDTFQVSYTLAGGRRRARPPLAAS